MQNIFILDLRIGNIAFVVRMVDKVGGNPIIITKKKEIRSAEKLIIPGVGSFDVGMQQIGHLKLSHDLVNRIKIDKIPVLGICLGMQLLCRRSEEGREPGLGVIAADVIDIELLYDNAMLAVNYQQAKKFGLKYILGGTNAATDVFRIPTEWNWFKRNKNNICSIAKASGIANPKTFPAIGTKESLWYHFICGIRWTSFLNFLSFNKFDALNELEENFGYKRYLYKRYEYIFTRFYQGYLLPEKFNVD